MLVWHLLLQMVVVFMQVVEFVLRMLNKMFVLMVGGSGMLVLLVISPNVLRVVVFLVLYQCLLIKENVKGYLQLRVLLQHPGKQAVHPLVVQLWFLRKKWGPVFTIMILVVL